MGALKPAQIPFLQLLLSGSTTIDAAQRLEIPVSTAQKWLQRDPNFILEYKHAREQMLDQAMMNLHARFDKAVKTIDYHMDAQTTDAKDQIKAAEIVIRQSIVTAELQRRIQSLEVELQTLKGQYEEGAKVNDHTMLIDLRALTPDQLDLLASFTDAIE